MLNVSSSADLRGAAIQNSLHLLSGSQSRFVSGHNFTDLWRQNGARGKFTKNELSALVDTVIDAFFGVGHECCVVEAVVRSEILHRDCIASLHHCDPDRAL